MRIPKPVSGTTKEAWTKWAKDKKATTVSAAFAGKPINEFCKIGTMTPGPIPKTFVTDESANKCQDKALTVSKDMLYKSTWGYKGFTAVV